MNQMLPLFKKEFIESWRNFKFAAILIVFAIMSSKQPCVRYIMSAGYDEISQPSRIFDMCGSDVSGSVPGGTATNCGLHWV